MADLSTTNSTYSTGGTDTWTSQVANISLYRAQHVNGLASAILQIEAALGSGSTLPGSLSSLAARLAVQVGSDGIIIPPGAGMDFFGSVAPTGWLFRDGSAVNRVAYPALFAAIGTTYGAGDGSTTFNVPDDRHRVTMGAGTGARDGESGSGVISGGTALAAKSIGEWGGASTVLLTGNQSGVQAHTHTVPTATDATGAGTTIANAYDALPGAAVSTASQSGDALEAHTNEMTYLVCNKIIKT